MCICVYLSRGMYMHEHRCLQSLNDPWIPGAGVVASCQPWMLGTKLGSPARAGHALSLDTEPSLHE